ncbi:hypothetical protein DHEL01_v210494 [Diaporthe helianthi]|uniref:Zn(2)-C6 fungal-type domain-containing protein n=1 Tax=Diaporthe helianthi TaxID=158607 RepID=A0A2P5HLH4_DIAHE|nr:hypothetical protein DHEL01_v210494 [Diaporthe helianthi]
MEGESAAASGSRPSSPPVTATSGTLSRTQRGAIAAQACDTCRSRKQKCDEQRPKCGTCVKFKLDCRYREPQPTKKDKTLVEILERIKSLEGKIDNLTAQGLAANFQSSLSGDALVQTPAPIGSIRGSVASVSSSAFVSGMSSDAAFSSGNMANYSYVSSVRAMLAWPAVQESLEVTLPNVSPCDQGFLLEREGISILQRAGTSFPSASNGRRRSRTASSLENPVATGSPSPAQVLNSLTWDSVQVLTKAFFDTFNLLHPIVDRQAFISTTLPAMFSNGLVFDESIQSTLTYLIFALGEVAIDAYAHPGGVNARTASQHPGLVFFNEARRRMGFNLTECSLENVQVFALAGCFNLELGMPLSGLDKYEALVRVPDFGGPVSQDDHTSHFQEHFASQIVLRRLSADFNNVLSGVSNSPASSMSSSSSPAPVIPGAIKPLVMQLDQWRELLPLHLRWVGRDHGTFLPPGHDIYGTSVFQGATPVTAPSPALPNATPPVTAVTAVTFTPDLNSHPRAYPYAMDIQVALLRTRYYTTRLLLYRPFLYKALHHPDQMNNEDADGVANCLNTCLMWPIIMSPACTRKLLIPCLFFWTQNILGALVILYMSEKVPILARIRASGICGTNFEADARETVRLGLEWIDDLRVVDQEAEWAWGVAKGIFGLDA